MMENLSYYLVKVNVVFTVLFILYYLFFRKEKFLVANRFILIVILFASFIFPLSPALNFGQPFLEAQNQIRPTLPLGHQLQIIPVRSGTALKHHVFFGYAGLAIKVYVLVLIGLFSAFTRHLIQLALIIKKSSRKKYEGIIYCDPTSPTSPFSFFHYIVISPNTFESERYHQIILHEHAHIRQWHSVDVLLTEISRIILWFNPLIYLYHRQVKLNLEYLADEATLNTGVDATSYQLTLLATVLKTPIYLPANSFFSSKLKDRIHMMNRLAPQPIRACKYFLFLPAVLLLSAFTGFKRNRIMETSLKQLINKNISIPQSTQKVSSLIAKPVKKEVLTPVTARRFLSKITIDATTDTVKFKLVPDSSGRVKRYKGIYVIDDKLILTDQQVRDSLKSTGELNFVLAKRPIFGAFTARDSSAIRYWGKKASKGVIFIRSPKD